MNWLVRWGIKKYVLGIVNGAIEKNNENVTKARWYVSFYITKAEALIAFLRNLDKKLEDGKIDEGEADALCKEAQSLAKDLTAKE